MNKRHCNIARNIWRSIEVFIFFVVSVVGFNLLVKTGSLNSKSKTNSLSEGIVASGDRSLPGISLPPGFGIDRLSGLLNASLGSERSHPSFPGFTSILQIPYHTLQNCIHIPNNRIFSTPSSLGKPSNLFQQNRILLI